jgi:small-conductance mechanosensitive channel
MRNPPWIYLAGHVGIALALALLCANLLAPATFAQAAEESVKEEAEPIIDLAPVIVDGEELFFVIGVSAERAEKRAADIAERIVEVAETGLSAPSFTIEDTEFGPAIYIDGHYIATVTQADVEYEGLDAPTLAKRVGERIQEEIQIYRDRRSESGLETAVIAAVSWTLLFVTFSVALWLGARYLREHVDQRIVSWVQRVENSTGKIVETDTIVSTMRATLWTVSFFIFVIALYYYLSQILFSIPETRGLAVVLLEYFTGPIFHVVWLIVGMIPDFIMLAIVYFVARYLLRIVRLVFENIELGTIQIQGFEPDWIWPTHRIAKTIVIIFAVIVAYPYIPGSDTAAFKGITIFLGVILSLGSSSVISNLLSGLFVIYRRSINVGDWIDVRGQVGIVESITLLETILRSPKNELVSIPNSQLLGAVLTNFTRQGETEGLLLHTSIGIGYEEPQKKVERMLLEAASRTDGLMPDPGPFVLRKELADYAVVYEVNAYASQVDALPKLKSDLHSNILDVFNENQVQIMTPSYIADPKIPKIAPTPDTKGGESAEPA